MTRNTITELRTRTDLTITVPKADINGNQFLESLATKLTEIERVRFATSLGQRDVTRGDTTLTVRLEADLTFHLPVSIDAPQQAAHDALVTAGIVDKVETIDPKEDAYRMEAY